MLSKLTSTVSAIAEQEEIKIEVWNMRKIETIERHLNDDGDIATAMTELEKVLGYKWDKFYGQIEHGLESNQ
jgi:hypothetical protein